MAHIERLRRYPVKGLDRAEADSVRISGSGTVAGDREFAMCEPTADRIETGEQMQTRAYNGKQTDRFHDLRTAFDPETRTLTVDPNTGGRREFNLSTGDGREAAGEWFSGFIGDDVEFRRHEPPAFVDRPDAGPSVISTATLENVASWFESMSVEGARRRLRANVEVGGVPAFWEDRFVGERDAPDSRAESGTVGTDAPGFVVDGPDGEVRFEGVEPCARCVVPSRDPETGDPIPGFRERFIERRKATFPEWADRDAFPHFYTIMLISRVPEASRGQTVRVGDDVWVRDA
jgi:uncharacterized protein YcbX